MRSLFSSAKAVRIFGITALSTFFLFFFAARLNAQDCTGHGTPGKVTNAGSIFLVCFMQNEEPGYDPGEVQQIYIAALDQPVTVTVTCRNYPTYKQVIPLLPRTSAIVEANHNPVISWPRSGIINTDEVEDSTVYRVESVGGSITCYGLNTKQFTADAFLCLPDQIAAFDYMVMSYQNSSLSGAERPSEFCVTAFKDNTTIEVTTTAPTQNGVPAGVATRYTLDSGTAVQIQASRNIADADLTGSTVKVIGGTSTNTPIAVYGGHSRTEVPSGYVYPDGVSTSRDHLADAMPPVEDWGCSFLTKNFGRAAGDFVRVLAKNDNTVVKINGQVWVTLMSGKFRDTLIANSQVAVNNIMGIESDPQHPLLVGMLAHTAASASDKTGDPFLAIVPPLEEGFNDYTYFIVNKTPDFDPSENFLTIVTEQGGVIGNGPNSNISILSNPIPAAAFTKYPRTINGGTYYVATVSQPTGFSHITGPAINQGNTQQGFSILAFGWGQVISYGYTAGAKFQPQTGIGCIAPPPGGNMPPSIKVRGYLSEQVYFDSARITYTENPSNNIVRLKKDIALETGRIQPAEEKTLELTTLKPVTDKIAGTVRIWYHSALWPNLIPVDFPFTIYPQTATSAGVNDQTPQAAATLENFPNPSNGNSSIIFSIPSRAYATVKIYDALGRVVRVVSQGTIDIGQHAFPVAGLSSGSYTIELSAPEIGVTEHRTLVVM